MRFLASCDMLTGSLSTPRYMLLNSWSLKMKKKIHCNIDSRSKQRIVNKFSYYVRVFTTTTIQIYDFDMLKNTFAPLICEAILTLILRSREVVRRSFRRE